MRSRSTEPTGCGAYLSVGLFADGTSNYGGSWNGVTGSVTGLFYGDASQLAAQLVGISTLMGFVFTFSFVAQLVLECLRRATSFGGNGNGGTGSAGNGPTRLPRVCLQPEPETMTHAHATAVAIRGGLT